MHVRHVLVAVKPGTPDAHPLWTGVELARRAGARYTVLSVNGSPPALPPRLNGSGPAAAITAVGVPAIEIARAAESCAADLIVLGRDRRTEMDRASRGAVAEGIVRRAHVPCLVVPHGHGAFRRVLAAVDGGPDAVDVMTVAGHVAEVFRAPVRAIQVEAGVLVGAGPTGWEPEPQPAPAVDTIVCHGDPVAEILRVVRDEDVGVLVFGHHRGGPVTGHATSGVGPRLLQRASCAVLTVPI